ncbi:MAG: hypothetical protein JEZ05_04235 [Tenericutes bacterium]|nr:hypothetical protein [Mycoplasmatota bacterium]
MKKAMKQMIATLQKNTKKENHSEQEFLIFRKEKIADTSIKMAKSNELHFVEKR